MKKTNDCIRCSVSTCAYHDAIAQHCTLHTIEVGCCEPNPKGCDSTECASFQAKKSGIF